MPWWILPVEIAGKFALHFGLEALEKKYPGIKPIVDKILNWLQMHNASAHNLKPIAKLDEHIDELTQPVKQEQA